MSKVNISISKINGKDVKRFKNEQDTNAEKFFYDESFEDYQNLTVSENGSIQMEIEINVEYDENIPLEEKELSDNVQNWFESQSKIFDKLRDFAAENNVAIMTAVQIQNAQRLPDEGAEL